MSLANLIFVVSHLKIHPAVDLIYFESSDVIAVKKKSLLKVYQLSLFLYSNSCSKKIKYTNEYTNQADKNFNMITLVTINIIKIMLQLR